MEVDFEFCRFFFGRQRIKLDDGWFGKSQGGISCAKGRRVFAEKFGLERKS